MSQGTPTRDGRNERHLMRQRGAGVRNITTNFGFSISFPSAPIAPQFAQAQLPAEPPAKRRRTNESVSPKRSTNNILVRAEEGISNTAESSESQPERIVAQPERSPAQPCREEKEATTEVPSQEQPSKSTKKHTRGRRKLCEDDEAKKQEDPGHGVSHTGGLEDTFIFGLKSKQQRPKRKAQVINVSESPEHVEKQLPLKVKRTTKASKQTDNKPIPQPIEDLPVKLDVVQEEPRASKKKPAAKKRTIAESDQPKETSEANLICDKSREPTTTAAMTNDPTKENTNLKSESIKMQPVKVKAAPRKANKRTLNEALGDVDDVSAAAPEKASKRPRRQAAISAIEKVTCYEEDLVPVDKLRRAPEAEIKPRKSRKAAVLEGLLETEPSSTVLPVPILHDNCNNDEEITPSEPQRKKRGRKKAVEIRKLNVNEDKFAESAYAIGHQTADHYSSTREKRHVTEVEPLHLKPPIAKRGRKPGAKAAKAIPAPVSVVSAFEELASVGDKTTQNASSEPEKHTEENHTPEDPETCTTIPASKDKPSKGLKGPSKSAKQHPKEAGKEPSAKPPTKTRRALADFDSNIVRRPSVSEWKKLDQSASPLAKQQKPQPEVQTQPQPQAKPRGRPTKAQPDQQSDIPPNDDPPLSTSKAPRKRHKISANEDLDWLFEDHSTRGARTAAAAAGGGTHLRQPKPKAVPRRKETFAASAEEMDLDDLLGSIAGFSGKLLTGQRARGVVTK